MLEKAYLKVAGGQTALFGENSVFRTDRAHYLQIHSSFCKLVKIMSWWSIRANFTSFDAKSHQVYREMNRFCKDRAHRPKFQLYHAIPVLAGSRPLLAGPPKQPICKLSTSRPAAT